MPRARILTLPRRLAFTLTELLIAVGVLVIVVLAAAKIFSAASRVSAIAGANADLIQTATAIEQQVRADFANLPRNAFMVLQQVEVNSFGANQSVDPSLGTAEIRADQIAFFTRGARTTTQYTGSQEASSNNGIATTWTPESAVARIYYGHGVQAPALPISTGPFSYENSNATVVPWKGGRVELERWTDGAAQGAGNIPLTKASLWPLVRLATLMGTDGLPTTIDNAGNASNTAYPRFGSSDVNASVTLFTNKIIRLGPLATKYPNTYAPLWTSGRVDVVKWQPDDLFSQMAFQADSQQIPSGIPFIVSNYSAPWSGPSSRLRMIQTLANWAAPATAVNPANGANALYLAYPRVEKAGPSASKADQMLTAPVLAANCSSFKVEWTWADGVGRSFSGYSDNTAPTGGEGIGMLVNPRAAQPWFGLDKLANGITSDLPNSAVRPVSNSPNFTNNGQVAEWGTVGIPLVVSNLASDDIVCSVEGTINRNAGDNNVRDRPVWRCSIEQDSKRVYQAVFGFNQDDRGTFNPSAFLRGPYTPLPSAIRITIRLHDPLGRIEGGRDFQFIVDLPKR
jgi:type II secretory pathway pseudopilin PulG